MKIVIISDLHGNGDWSKHIHRILGPPTANNASRLLLAIVNRHVQRKVV